MNRVVAFGNCQADALTQMLEVGLPASDYSVEFVSNNPRTGGMQSPETVLETVAAADLVLFQPLRERHGPIAEEGIRAAARGRTITFPYLFNSGMAALCQAPSGADHSYGRIFGEEPILRMLEQGASDADVHGAYERGEIDFRLPERFEECIVELEQRETATDIRTAASIRANYRETQQFLAHNHPTAALLTEILTQLEQLSGLPIDFAAIEAMEGEPLRGAHRCPISPHDAEALGYRFGLSRGWQRFGAALIDLICDEYRRLAAGQAPSVAADVR